MLENFKYQKNGTTEIGVFLQTSELRGAMQLEAGSVYCWKEGLWDCCVAQVAVIWAWKVMTYGAPAELQVEAVPRCALEMEMWPEVLRM